MKLSRLIDILQATRDDLIDGYPAKIALRAISGDGAPADKCVTLNELLVKHDMHVVIKPTDHDSFFAEHGIIGAEIDASGHISIDLAEHFFSSCKTPLKQALRFQSIVAHELIHRDQMKASSDPMGMMQSAGQLDDIAYINDPFEIEAMSAEIVHDLAAKSLLACDGLIEGSTRLNFIMHHAGHMSPVAIDQFQAEMAESNSKA